MEPMKATSVNSRAEELFVQLRCCTMQGTREDWLHIVGVCDKSLEKYYLRIKK